jgi:hypothetical protein
MPAKRQPKQDDLFGSDDQLPAGFGYRENILSAAEESEAVGRFKMLPFKPFEFHGYLGNRRVVSFGWRYDYSGSALRESAPLPDFLLELRQSAAAFAGLPPGSLQQALVTEYSPGAGIATSPCSRMSWRSRFCRPAVCASGASAAMDGSALHAQSRRGRFICSAAPRARNGITAFRPSRHCAIR